MDNENKRYTVVISDVAKQMLLSHARFLSQVSKDAAMELIEEFQVKASSLEEFPARNPWLVIIDRKKVSHNAWKRRLVYFDSHCPGDG